METRKLIKFGGSSHIIAIPNEWIKKNSLGKGDTIYVEENGDNELILHPSFKEKKYEERHIKINANKLVAAVKREIISAYINNYNVIEISGNKLKQKRKEIEELVNNLVAMEIIEEEPNRIVARDFLNMEEVSIDNLIRRIDIIIRFMTERIFEEDKNIAYEEIRGLDKGVNKLRFLLFKVIKTCMNDNNLSRKLKVSNYGLLKTWLMVSYLEEIADEVRRFMRFMKNTNLTKEEIAIFNNLFYDIKGSYINIMEAYYKNDIAKAHEVSSQRDIHMKKCNGIFKKNTNKDIIPMVEKIKSIESWIRCIARGILNG